MELALKIKEGKTPFVGILFAQDYDACRFVSTQWVRNHPDEEYKLVIRTFGEVGDLTLVNEKIDCRFMYSNLRVNRFELRAFVAAMRPKQKYKFGHVIRSPSKQNLELVKLSDKLKPWLLNVNEIVFTGTDHVVD
jgi:hypothetical protein